MLHQGNIFKWKHTHTHFWVFLHISTLKEIIFLKVTQWHTSGRSLTWLDMSFLFLSLIIFPHIQSILYSCLSHPTHTLKYWPELWNLGTICCTLKPGKPRSLKNHLKKRRKHSDNRPHWILQCETPKIRQSLQPTMPTFKIYIYVYFPPLRIHSEIYLNTSVHESEKSLLPHASLCFLLNLWHLYIFAAHSSVFQHTCTA